MINFRRTRGVRLTQGKPPASFMPLQARESLLYSHCAGCVVFADKAESPSRSRRWAVSEKSGIDFSEGPPSEADSLSVSIFK